MKNLNTLRRIITLLLLENPLPLTLITSKG
jgi:hypothetical protein